MFDPSERAFFLVRKCRCTTLLFVFFFNRNAYENEKTNMNGVMNAVAFENVFIIIFLDLSSLILLAEIRVMMTDSSSNASYANTYYGTSNEPEADLPMSFTLLDIGDPEGKGGKVTGRDIEMMIMEWMEEIDDGNWPTFQVKEAFPILKFSIWSCIPARQDILYHCFWCFIEVFSLD